ncbi:MAG: hypothetical protein HUU50_00670 [Candidatus Brocadiae bacterium]|nr:hypothetical protein [Candidatus Brocadiia bacterium]
MIFNLCDDQEQTTSAERSDLLKVFINAALTLDLKEQKQLDDFTSQMAGEKNVKTLKQIADWFIKTASLSDDQRGIFWKYWEHQWFINRSEIQNWRMALESEKQKNFDVLSEGVIRTPGQDYSFSELASFIQSPLPSDWNEPEPGSISLWDILNLPKNNGQTERIQPAKIAETTPMQSEVPATEVFSQVNASLRQVSNDLSQIENQANLIGKSCARIERFQSETNKFCGEIKGGFDGINRDIESKKQSYEQLMKSQIEMKESNLQTKQLLESLQEKIISLEKQCAQSQTKLTQQYNLLLQQKKEPQIPDGLLRDFEGQAKEIIQSDSQIQKEIRYIFLIWIITFFMLVIMIASH